MDDSRLTIHHGDCLDKLKTVSDSCVDLFFTSPPYAQQRSHEYSGVDVDLYVEWFCEVAREIKRTLKESGSFFLNINPHCENKERSLYVYKLVIALRENVGLFFQDEYVWYKSATPRRRSHRLWDAWEPVWYFSKSVSPYINYTAIEKFSRSTFAQKRGYASYNKVTGNVGGYHDIAKQRIGKTLPDNVLYFPTSLMVKDAEYKHPAKFPLELAQFLCKGYCPPGGTVCDPFLGSGTTACAALSLGMECIGIEMSADYIETTKRRIDNYQSTAKRKPLRTKGGPGTFDYE